MPAKSRFESDLAHLTTKFKQQQAEADAFDACFDLPRTDLAYREASKRRTSRLAPRRTWAEEKAVFKAYLQLEQHKAAIYPKEKVE